MFWLVTTESKPWNIVKKQGGNAFWLVQEKWASSVISAPKSMLTVRRWGRETRLYRQQCSFLQAALPEGLSCMLVGCMRRARIFLRYKFKILFRNRSSFRQGSSILLGNPSFRHLLFLSIEVMDQIEPFWCYLDDTCHDITTKITRKSIIIGKVHIVDPAKRRLVVL